MTLTDALAAALEEHTFAGPNDVAETEAAAILADPAFREALTAAVNEGVNAAWRAHLGAMQLEYETGVEMFDKEAVPSALASAILAVVLP